MKYKVWYGKGHKFDRMSDAEKYRDFIFRKTKLVVAITEVVR